jgi:diguanylate cyclase (GGDEF)-like protein
MYFPALLERRFERDTGRDRCRSLVLRGLLGLALFNIFLISDWQLMPDQADYATLLRLGLVTPLALAVMLVTWRNPPPYLREGLQGLIVVLANAVPPLLILASESPLRESGHHGILLVVMFATMVQRIRFWYVLAAVLAISATYAATLSTLGTLASQEIISFNMVFAGGVIFSLVASYGLEHEQRLSYLLGLRNRMRNAELEATTRRDPLTGLGNRRLLDETLDALRHARGEEVAMLLIDIDSFKAFNDSLGHQAGDTCLRLVADAVSAELRTGSDHAFRYGGEEFLLVLRRTDMADAFFVAERVRAAVERAALPHPAAATPIVTASIGVAATRVGEGVPLEQLIADADAALYMAKRDGRNRVAPRQSALQDDHPMDDLIWAKPWKA